MFNSQKVKVLIVALSFIFAFFCYDVIAEEETMTVTDMIGRDVRVPVQAKRILCAGPGTLRLIVYLKAADKLVGIESGFEKDSPVGRPYRIAHPEVANLPSIGQASPSPRPNPEMIIKLKPHVIFISYADKRLADRLQNKTGIPVVVLSYGDFSTFDNEMVFGSLTLAGKILGKDQRARQVIGFIDDIQRDLKHRAKKIHQDEKPTVYIAGLGYKGTHGITSTDFSYQPFVMLSAPNVVASVGSKGHVFIDKEKIIELDPDIIFIDGSGAENIENDYRANRFFYNQLKAFRHDEVYRVLPYNYYTTNIDTALADTYYIGKIIYPGSFLDVEPDKMADKIYNFLVGRPVYRQMEKDWGGFKKMSLYE